jgi:hypothetical protein
MDDRPVVIYGDSLNSKCLAYVINLSQLDANFIKWFESFDFNSLKGKVVYVCEFNYRYPYDLHLIASKIVIVGCHKSLTSMWSRASFLNENIDLVFDDDSSEISDIEFAWNYFFPRKTEDEQIICPEILTKFINFDIDICVYMRTLPEDICKWSNINHGEFSGVKNLTIKLICEAEHLAKNTASYYLHNVANKTVFVTYVNVQASQYINPFLLEEIYREFPHADCLACWFYDDVHDKTFYKLFSADFNVSLIAEQYQGSGYFNEAELEYSGNIYPMDFQKVATFDIVDILDKITKHQIRFQTVVGNCALLKASEEFSEDYVRPHLLNFIQRKCEDCLFIMFQILLEEEDQYEYRLFVNDKYVITDENMHEQMAKLGLFAGSVRHVSFTTKLEFEQLPLQIEEDYVVSFDDEEFIEEDDHIENAIDSLTLELPHRNCCQNEQCVCGEIQEEIQEEIDDMNDTSSVISI